MTDDRFALADHLASLIDTAIDELADGNCGLCEGTLKAALKRYALDATEHKNDMVIDDVRAKLNWAPHGGGSD